MIDIRQEPLLPVPFRILGFILLASGTGMTAAFLITLFTQGRMAWGLAAGVLVAAAGIILAFSHYRLMIDTANRKFKVTTWVLWFRRGEWEPFEYVEKFFINRVIQSTTVSSFTGHPHQVKDYLFKAFMKLDNGEKIHVDSDNTEHRLEVRIALYKEQLGAAYVGE